MKSGGDTKQAIFEAAADLFAKDGYHNVSMREIADSVGVTSSSIYNHYESKEAILLDIYHYFDDNMTKLQPDIPQLLKWVETLHPHDVLRRTTMIYPPEILDNMARSMLVTSSMTRADPRADQIIYKNLIDLSFKVDCPILEKMMALDLIEPLDIESFALIHSCYSHSAAVRFYTDHMIDNETWFRGLETIFQLVRVKKTPK